MTTEHFEDDAGTGEFDGANAFFQTSHKDAEGKAVAPDGTAPGVTLGTPDREEAETAPDASTATAVDPDDAELEWGEGETKTKASLKALKETFAARTANEAKWANVAAVQAASLEKTARAETALNAMVAKAQAKWAPYSTIDFLALSRDQSVDQETFEQIRKDANEAMADYNYLTKELSDVTRARATETQASMNTRAQAALVELNDPKTGVPGFNSALYTKMVDHAVAAYGAPKNVILAQPDSWDVKLMHDAMLYRTGATTATEQLEKVRNRPTKVLTPGAAPAVASASTDRKAAIAKLRQSDGGTDDAADAFFATSRRAA